MSLVSVLTLLLLTMVLGMVMNSARQVDHKVKMQNAADAATWTGGLVMSRSLNSLAFTNHLLADVFALTAFMREAHDNHSELPAQEILDHWQRMGPFMATSEFPAFADLGNAIVAKVPIERQMVSTWCDWARSSADAIRPVLEDILLREAIPEFQRTLVMATPQMTQIATEEIAQRHGRAWPTRTRLHGVLWRTSVDPVGGAQESTYPSLPVVDPISVGGHYQLLARRERDFLAHTYLRDWNDEKLQNFDGRDGAIGQNGKMSQYANLWRIFSCGQLRRLLEDEYPDQNLPFQLRFIDAGNLSYQRRVQDDLRPNLSPASNQPDLDEYLERDFMFVGVVYSQAWPDIMPGLFRSPGLNETQAYAQVMLTIPRRRLVPDPVSVAARQSSAYHAMHWDLTNQNWQVQLTAATALGIPEILSTSPQIHSISGSLPNLRGLTTQDLDWLSHH